MALADIDGTTITRNYTYTPDGVATTSGSGATTDIQFAGGHSIAGLYHFGARYYNPNLATWTQPDPLNQIASLTEANHYAYAGGDPVDNTDLLGKATAGGRCIEGRAGFDPEACRRAGFKITSASKWKYIEEHAAEDERVGDCRAAEALLLLAPELRVTKVLGAGTYVHCSY
jgi:RHS repeat-associated protein